MTRATDSLLAVGTLIDGVFNEVRDGAGWGRGELPSRFAEAFELPAIRTCWEGARCRWVAHMPLQHVLPGAYVNAASDVMVTLTVVVNAVALERLGREVPPWLERLSARLLLAGAVELLDAPRDPDP